MKPRPIYWMCALAAAFLIGKMSGLATAPAKGEFYRAVPRWWIGPALCVHRHEASWNNPGVYWNGGRSPYYGGMSMDIGFQRSYGGWIYQHLGTANRWPWQTQLLVAYRGWRHRGWEPWPNSSRACGLL